MKRLIMVVVVIVLLIGLVLGCGLHGEGAGRDYRQDMRDFVEGIGAYAKGLKVGFIVIPQNGQELVSENGEATGVPAIDYLNAIDGLGREDLFYGYDNDNVATTVSERDYIIAFLDIAKSKGVEVLVTDYCSTDTNVNDSYAQNNSKGYISFAANHRDLDNIPAYPTPLYNVNTSNITSLSTAKNFLYLLDTSIYATKAAFLNDVQSTNYDVVIIDLFYDGTEEFTPVEVSSLRTKAIGGERLVIAYMSIGEAEDYRYYWQSEWVNNPTAWLAEENPDWPGNYNVRYWMNDWHNIIYGNDNSYLKKIIDAGFDGVYLDIIDGFEYFE